MQAQPPARWTLLAVMSQGPLQGHQGTDVAGVSTKTPWISVFTSRWMSCRRLQIHLSPPGCSFYQWETH